MVKGVSAGIPVAAETGGGVCGTIEELAQREKVNRGY
jgi:hypothetical protein